MSCSDIVSGACSQWPSCKVKEHKDWKDGRAKPPGIDGMEAVFDAFCTAGSGGGGGRAGAMVGRCTFKPVFIAPGCSACNWNTAHSVYFSLSISTCAPC